VSCRGASSSGSPPRRHPRWRDSGGPPRRSFFGSQQGTPAAGSQWKLGAIGVARWRGVPLAEVLERAGIPRRAVDVMPEGLDPEVTAQGHVRRPRPVEKALQDVRSSCPAQLHGPNLPRAWSAGGSPSHR
jgi:DMSO/TMAO reductase YedYZ molybdopterin-dependent catalytic subunit